MNDERWNFPEPGGPGPLWWFVLVAVFVGVFGLGWLGGYAHALSVLGSECHDPAGSPQNDERPPAEWIARAGGRWR